MRAVAIADRAVAAAGAEMTFVLWRVLLVVGERAEGAGVSDIAAPTCAHASPTGRLSSCLRHRGIAVTEEGGLDGRVAPVRRTEVGAAPRARARGSRRRDLAHLPPGALTLHDAEAIERLAAASGSCS